ncbi:glycoside hydrolase family 43 [Pyrenophora seminiperda CCB06]|uniref:Arabinan endo-1,5-alpha-L-arabinosidase n=1 Tax=Pyrenophora seminiperda CCB06 TaxID=1302712 RepID=A0A3M7MBY1_9PLEO|nr:glycoside hydrolase family 43 [Pyrenophora seminiperda CCB06]
MVGFTTLLTTLLATSTTFLPLVIQSAAANPVPIPLPDTQAGTPALVSVYPDPEECRGNCSWIHDPSIWYESGTYWRFSTSGNIAIATAPSLGGPWQYQGALLTNGTEIFVVEGQDIWAPSVTKRGDTYYCHYSVSRIGRQDSAIGVATSKSLSPGTWVDHGSVGLPLSDKYNLIDPFVYQETLNSPIYFTFGSYWNDIFQVNLPYDADLLNFGALAGQNNLISNVIRNTTTNPAVVEGATMFKSDDFYYMFYSVGQCCNTPKKGLFAHDLAPADLVYHVVVCRSTAPNGPFHDRVGKSCLDQNGGTTILASHGDIYAPGGQGVMIDPQSGRPVLYYHYVRPSIGYNADQFFFGYNYLDFSSGWPAVVGT